MGNTNSTSGGKRLTGKVVVISNYNVNNEGEEKSTDKDLADIKSCLEPLGLCVEDIRNGTKENILSFVQAYAQQLSSDDSLILVIVRCHGCEGGVLLAGKNDTYCTSDIWKPFLRDELGDKLKLFIFQACRGGKTEEKISPNSKISVSTNFSWNKGKLPHMRNFLLAYSTIDHHVSYGESGSLYIQSLCAEIRLLTNPEEIVRVLTRVTNAVTARCIPATTNAAADRVVGQTPQIVSFIQNKFFVPKSPVGAPTLSQQQQYPRDKRHLVIIYHSNEQTLKEHAGVLQTNYRQLNCITEVRNYQQENPNQYLLALSQDSSRLQNVGGLHVVFLAPVTTDDSNEFRLTLGKADLTLVHFWTKFIGSKCKHLLNRPKVFIALDTAEHNDAAGKIVMPPPVNNHADMMLIYGFGHKFFKHFSETMMSETADLAEILRTAMELTHKDDKTFKRHSHFESSLRYPLNLQPMP